MNKDNWLAVAGVAGGALAAEVFVGIAACLLLLVDAATGGRARGLAFALAMAALVGAAWVTWAVAVDARTVLLAGHYVADPMGTVLKLFAYGAAAVTLLYSRDYLVRRGYGYDVVRTAVDRVMGESDESADVSPE